MALPGPWAPDALAADLDQRSDERLGGFTGYVHRSLPPPLRDRRFWAIQALVVILAGVHLLADLRSSVEAGAFPDGIPVALLIVPVGYAAVRYGLTGSAATAIWATVLWLPDLLNPHDQGHAPSDVVNLVLVDAVDAFFGQRMEAEGRSNARVERATLRRLRAEAGYRQLFEANRAPILVLDPTRTVRAANPAARRLFGERALGMPARALVGDEAPIEMLRERVVTLRDGRDYRLALVELPDAAGDAAQLDFGDVTEERREAWRSAWRSAWRRSLMVAAEEEQRRRNALCHANARHVRVRIWFGSDLLRLGVADDGRGFVVADGDNSGAHLDLVGMAERASLLGGSLDVRSSPGHGTEVRANVPLNPVLRSPVPRLHLSSPAACPPCTSPRPPVGRGP